MKTAFSKSLPLTILSTGALFFLMNVAFSPASHGVSASEDAARLVVREAQIRNVLNTAVVVLQLIGVSGFLLTTFVPGGRLARHGRLAFVSAMLGLGVAGSLCAWYGSEFALFSGGSMAVLLIGVILASESSPHGTVSGLLHDAERSPLAV